MQVGLGPGHIVLDGDPAPSSKGAQPLTFGPYLWPNGGMDQDATWYGGRPPININISLNRKICNYYDYSINYYTPTFTIELKLMQRQR